MNQQLVRGAVAASLIATVAVAIPSPASAQEAGCTAPAPKKPSGIGGLLSSAKRSGLLGSSARLAKGRQGTAEVAERAADIATQASNCRAARDGSDTRPVPGQSEAIADSSPATSNPGRATRAPAQPTYRYPSQMPKPADFAAVSAAYMEFGKDRCGGCEGGYAYDGWASFPRDEYSGKYNGDANRMGSWPIGHVHHWKGNISSGSLTVLGEESVEGFRCRRLRYRLERGSASAERPGLLCWGRANQFAGKESWNTVY